MDDSISTRGALADYTSEYVRRLLVERRFIYAKLYNQGGSVILRDTDIVDHDRPTGYSTEIGNSFHLDLIQLEIEFEAAVEEGDLTVKQVNALLTWADGMTSQQAADYLHARGPVSIRKLRSRATTKLKDRMNDSARTKGTGRTGNGTIGTGRTRQPDNIVS